MSVKFASVAVLIAALTPGTTAWEEAELPAYHYPSLQWNNNATPQGSPSYHYTAFTYATSSVTRTATSVPPTSCPTYALPYASVSSRFANVSTTTWPNWTPSASSQSTTQTDAAGPAYGTLAYSALWNAANPTNFSRGLYSTTVSPTAVPTSELIFPPPLYFQPDTSGYKFPANFVYGAAGSASQCEGAVADQGKAPTFMDMLANIFSLVGTGAGGALGVNPGSSLVGDYVTNEHYYLYKQDIERLASIGLKHYSFSISWARIFPFALPGTPANAQAVAHYDDLINFVLSKGMQPIVTLHHFDTPLQFFGGGKEYLYQEATSVKTYGPGFDFGFSNATFKDAFIHYAEYVMSQYADRVPIWITFNEPQIGVSNGKAVDTVLKAHAHMAHFYRDVLKGKGQISLKNGITPAVPQDAQNQSHIEAANFFSDLYVGVFMTPLALGGDYPIAYKNAVPDYVPLSQKDLEYLNGTMDFVALDAYSAPVVAPLATDLQACAKDINGSAHRFPTCIDSVTLTPNNWSTGYSPFGSKTGIFEPLGLRQQLSYAWNTYRKPVLISEFGQQIPAPPGGRLQDNLFNVPGSEYILGYMNEVLKSIWEDGVEVLGAISWNWGDDWEFGTFDPGFGLQFINHTTQERKYRRSFFDVIDFVESKRQR